MARYRLLSIDGGGIRGLLPAVVLAEIEKRTRARISALFDVVAGTSTGGILALALTVGADGRPRYSAEELVDLYKNNGREIFSKREPWRTIDALVDRVPLSKELGDALGIPRNADLHDLVRPKYPPDGRKAVLRRYFGDARVQDALIRVFVTSYDTDQRVPVFFDSAGDEDELFFDRIRDVSMVDAAMATSAAPTYFPPHPVKARRPLSLVDGGVFANNPVVLAYAFTRPRDAGDPVIVSVGTGSMTQSYAYEEIRNWGAVRWAGPALYTMMDGQSEAAALVMKNLLPAERFFRWQALLSDAGVPQDMDDASEETIGRICSLAERLVKTKSDEIDRVCNLLSPGPGWSPKP
jgi:patatin-like phospholipase/acyl hydrolase